jgi:hypothetical protein
MKTKVVKCQVCSVHQDDYSEYPNIRSGAGHTMIVLSVWNDESGKRIYFDFCSMDCLLSWAKGMAGK